MNRFLAYVLIAAFLTACGSPQSACAATSAQSITFLLSQVRQVSGPLSGGKVYAYAAGTTTPKTIWTDRGKTTPAANPYTLDSNGTAALFGDGLYRFVIKTAAGVTVYDRDNISIRDALSYGIAAEDYATLALADAAATAAGKLLVISTVYTTVPTTLTSAVQILPGGQLNGSGTVAITGQFEGSDGCFGVNQSVTGLSGNVNLRWFTGFDAADASAALQAAANAGDGIYGPAGTYTFSTGINIPIKGTPDGVEANRWSTSGGAITGEGRRTKFIYTGTSGYAFTFAQYSNHAVVSDVSIEAPNGTAGGIKTIDAMHRHIERCSIKVAGTAIELTGSAVGTITKNVLDALICLKISGGDVDISGNDFYPRGTDPYGVQLMANGDIKISNNTFTNVGTNGVMVGSTGATFIAQLYTNNNQYYMGSDSAGSAIRFPEVTGNDSLVSSHFYHDTMWSTTNYTGNFIDIYRARDVTFDNIVHDHRSGSYQSTLIKLISGQSCVITGNILYGSSGQLLNTTNLYNTVLSGNVYNSATSTPAAEPILISGTGQYLNMYGNIITKPGTESAFAAIKAGSASTDVTCRNNRITGFAGQLKGVDIPFANYNNSTAPAHRSEQTIYASVTGGNTALIKAISSTYYNRVHVRAWVTAITGQTLTDPGYYEAFGMVVNGVLYVKQVASANAAPGSNQGVEMIVSAGVNFNVQNKTGLSYSQTSTAVITAWYE